MYQFTKAAALDRLTLEISQSTITIALDRIDLLGTDDLKIYFKDTLPVGQETVLAQIVSDHVNTPLPHNVVQTVTLDSKKTDTGLLKFAGYEPEGSGATVGTHDFTKKQTWYQQSVAVTAQALTSEDNLTFSSPHSFWIDLTHCLMYDEDTANVGGMYNPVIKVDGSIVTAGFTINYVTGAVVFTSAVLGVVTASYYYATTSYFVLKPTAGKTLAIKTAKVQFTTDIAPLTSPMCFEAWVNHPTYGLIPVPNSRIAYKSFKDFITACNGGQGLIPKIGELQNDVHVFPFEYARPKPIKYSQGVEIRVYIADHQPISGEYANATFYITVEPEEV